MALRRVRADVLPFFGGGSLTPARRALERPRAMPCLAERAPCLPSRTWWISSRTNLAGLRGGTLAFAAVASGPFERSLLRHGPPPAAVACERCASDYAFLLVS